jgi:hypothetical protein
MQRDRRFESLAAAQEGVQHVARNWAGPNDRHLNRDVIETARPRARKNGLLRSAFHLEESDSIRLLQCVVDERIVLRQMCQIHRLFIVLWDRRQTVLEDRHHAQPQQINFNDLHVRAIVFIPLDDMAPGHGCGFQRNDGIKLALADDEAARVLAQVSWQLKNFFC